MRREQLAALVFEVDGQQYGVHARDVHEIVRAVMPTRLPKAPAVIAGVLNVRGRVVPLVDLRTRFGRPPRRLQADEVFVLLRTGERMLAFRADRALELMQIPAEALSSIESSVPRASYLAGTVPLPSGVLLICDPALFLDEAERATLEGALREQTEGSAQ